MIEPVQPIRPELLASKIERIRNYEQPHLLEEFGADSELVPVLWFLQYVSRSENYAGGLGKFAADLIASEGDLIGTTCSKQIGYRAAKYTVKEAAAVLKELPRTKMENLFQDNYWAIANAFEGDSHCVGRGEHDGLLLRTLTPACVQQICTEAARTGLAAYLKDVCELPHTGLRPQEFAGRALTPRAELDAWLGVPPRYGAPWYFANVADALVRFIEKRKHALLQEIASTEVTRLITRWIAKSQNTREHVMITGSSRFGKTEAIKLYARMDPGTCRLVDTREGNALGDLAREIARSLGIEVGPQNSLRDLRDRIDYVLRCSNLQLIFDESQFLLPASYSRSTAPARLNYVRRSIMDQGTPVVLVCTPQSYLPAKRRFVKATGFAMEQFDERFLKTVRLPEEPREEDLFAIARVHLPRLADEYLRFVVTKTLAAERNFVSDIKRIAALANDNARENGRKLPILADIKAAMVDVLPVAISRTKEGDQMRIRNVSAEKAGQAQAASMDVINGQSTNGDFEQLSRFSRRVRAPLVRA